MVLSTLDARRLTELAAVSSRTFTTLELVRVVKEMD